MILKGIRKFPSGYTRTNQKYYFVFNTLRFSF